MRYVLMQYNLDSCKLDEHIKDLVQRYGTGGETK